jgi:hypothetical protein
MTVYDKNRSEDKLFFMNECHIESEALDKTIHSKSERMKLIEPKSTHRTVAIQRSLEGCRLSSEVMNKSVLI